MGEPAMSFDPFEYIDELVKGGFTKKQAEAQAKAQIKLVHDLTEHHVAKKQDLKALEGRMDSGFTQVDHRFEQMDRRFEQLEERMNSRFEQLEGHMNSRFEQFDAKFNGRSDHLGSTLNGRIDQLGSTLNGRIDQLGSTLNSRIDQLENRIDKQFLKITVSLGTIMMAGIALLSILMKFLLQTPTP